MESELSADDPVLRIAAAIGEPARARMLYSLMDNRARTGTELALAANVSPPTASVHLSRLKAEGLVRVQAQGKHRYYTLEGSDVASVLEGLRVIAGVSGHNFEPNTPHQLRHARTCYDHIAGSLGVSLHDRLNALGWLETVDGETDQPAYGLTPKGMKAIAALGVNLAVAGNLRRRFAYGCLDWSERRPHIGGALGAALLDFALKRRWVARDLDTRALSVTSLGRREMLAQFGLLI
jgi:DNA-binding transcriptional ArsR family regulator